MLLEEQEEVMDKSRFNDNLNNNSYSVFGFRNGMRGGIEWTMEWNDMLII